MENGREQGTGNRERMKIDTEENLKRVREKIAFEKETTEKLRAPRKKEGREREIPESEKGAQRADRGKSREKNEEKRNGTAASGSRIG